MFYFTCNESKIYESFTFWNKLQEKNELFHDILIYWDAPVIKIFLFNQPVRIHLIENKGFDVQNRITTVIAHCPLGASTPPGGGVFYPTHYVWGKNYVILKI